MNREVLREALLSLGAEGDFVSNGVEAVEAAAKKSYDIIFMDGSMPEMDGFTATRPIREAEARSEGKRALVVALTAQVRGADADAWAAVGGDRHMTKPFTSARLMDALKSVGGGLTAEAVVSAPPSFAAPEAAPETPLIDDESVATMEAVGARSGRDVLGKVWRLFLGQAPDAVFKLETLCARGRSCCSREAGPLPQVYVSVFRGLLPGWTVRGHRAGWQGGAHGGRLRQAGSGPPPAGRELQRDEQPSRRPAGGRAVGRNWGKKFPVWRSVIPIS